MSERVVTVEELGEILRSRSGGRRLVVGVAGAPGCGKSTLAERLADVLNGPAPSPRHLPTGLSPSEKKTPAPALAAVFPMDGYHYDDAVLVQLGRLARKGAPDTFDVGGLAHMLRRLSENAEDEIAVPVFDRTIETSRAGGRLIAKTTGIIIAEGNYLLLKRPPWDQLDGLFDATVMVRASLDTLRTRLEARWRHFNLSEDEVRRKVDTNDLPNGMTVINESRDADFVIDSGDDDR